MTSLDIALDYIARGWNPVPVPPRTKGPSSNGWQRRLINAASAPHFFTNNENVGIILGPMSHGLTDIDLDCREAVAIAPYVLPPTKAIFGRASKRCSHWLYYTDLAINAENAAVKYNDPRTKGAMVELRIGGDKGAQTIFPGSTHPSGEAITWDENGEPANVDDAELRRKVRALAAYSSLARYWPGKTSHARHEAARTLGGFLSRAGFEPPVVKVVAEAIARAANDEEWRDRRTTAEDAAKAHRVGKNAYGLPAMREIFGTDIADKVAMWLDYGEDTPSSESTPAFEASEPHKAVDKRPVIVIEPGKLSELATKGETALIDAGLQIYVHGEALQRPIVDEVEASKGRRTHVARFATINIDMMRDFLGRAARWRKYNERKKGHVDADPPRDVAAIVLARAGEWRFPPAAGVITCPTLRSDGSILCTPGYDPDTRLILLNPPIMPPIPTAPTKDHAAAALALLDGLISEFPFTDQASRSVALSELICPVVRGSMAVVPLHANRAPVAGTGKSYIVDVSSVISSGQPCPTIAPGCDEFELEKRLGAALVRGQAMVSIDNVNGELRGDFLCQVVERPIVRVRPLGFSNLVQIESKTCVYATGNNLILVGDVVRRTLLCSLDPQLERPELRRFKSNPVQTVLANRGVYIAAALTVVRAYLAAGYPGELPALASFEDWSRLVRSALVWLGHADPVQTMETAREEDPELDALRRVYQAWNGTLGPQPITTGALVEVALHKDYEGKLTKPELHDALMEIAWSNGALSPKKLGHWLKRYRNRIVSGIQLASAYDTNAKQHVWRVRAIASGSGTER